MTTIPLNPFACLTAHTPMPTVADILTWYEAHEIREYSPDALKERRRVWGLFREQFGDLSIDVATSEQLLDFLVSQKGAKSNWTRRRMKATICRPFNVAAQVGIIPRNPFAGLAIPKGGDGRDWSDEEYASLLRAAAPYVRRLIVFIRFSGSRPGEARTLQWTQIREEAQVIVQKEHKTAHCRKDPRRIYFNHVLVRLLAWLYRNRSHPKYVFVNRRNRPWTIRALSNHFAILRDRAGLAADVRCHSGRHCFATNALLSGVDIYTLAQLLGHASVKTTERYLHLLDKKSHLNAAMEKAIVSRQSNPGSMD